MWLAADKTFWSDSMAEEEWKNIYKFCIDHRYENLSIVQKELLKKAIDEAGTFEELVVTAMAAIGADNKGVR